MKSGDSHLSDERLLLELEGELPVRESKQVLAHVAACWKCRTRRQKIENAITDFVRAYQEDFDSKLPPVAGQRALLKARLAQFSATEPNRFLNWFRINRIAIRVTALCGAAVIALLTRSIIVPPGLMHRDEIVFVPDSRLTPGATVLVSRRTVCSQSHENNRRVSAAIRRKVFEEYGISGADPKAYEIDYLVTPALGGADDIHNLWPHSYTATVWNAQVKDALEDRLRIMVCDGRLELADAQREIADNWIAAYKKYFHSDEPLTQH